LHCIVGEYIFTLYMTCQLNVQNDDDDDVQSLCNWRWLQVYVCCISQGIINRHLKRDWWFWCHFISNLSRYMTANTYFNIEMFYKVIATIKRCSFLPQGIED